MLSGWHHADTIMRSVMVPQHVWGDFVVVAMLSACGLVRRFQSTLASVKNKLSVHLGLVEANDKIWTSVWQ